MRKSPEETAQVKEAKIELGRLIRELHNPTDGVIISIRKLADGVKIPPSSMKYIEDGVNAPSPEAYQAIVDMLKPDDQYRAQMDEQYSIIRGTPPPDVCKVMCSNPALNNTLRTLKDTTLTKAQIAEIDALITSFKDTAERGVARNV